ncbi:hypothetical protein L1987_58373 [Smallanthus sonchifolius]|uniref:Uncharacterized protein n=1 Tax=Smallanthus sonchifolius TaxID=185202 RepID=A0ACB9DFX3_9ASTR|nr:hypothetical protein L1987_58373 [Smallanthus sonchifolius]
MKKLKNFTKPICAPWSMHVPLLIKPKSQARPPTVNTQTTQARLCSAKSIEKLRVVHVSNVERLSPRRHRESSIPSTAAPHSPFEDTLAQPFFSSFTALSNFIAPTTEKNQFLEGFWILIRFSIVDRLISPAGKDLIGLAQTGSGKTGPFDLLII